jgi:cyclopropane fatty-acyl-phospholipid synthase-like methyltransferase
MSHFPDTPAIRRYYEQNTRLFLAFGSSPRAHSIHRAVWADGIADLDEALDYTNRLILVEAQEIQRRLSPVRLRLVDLGCGIGGSLFYLLERITAPAVGVGLTISALQARLANRRSRQLALPHPCLFAEADFLAPPMAGGVELVYSVEAFIHAASSPAYFAGVATLLRPGGRLILVDDFLAANRAPFHAEDENPWLAAYQAGWHAPNLDTVSQAVVQAQAHGLRLILDRDLTPDLRLRLLPDSLARWLLRAGSHLPLRHAILPSLLGSMALQQCLHMGLIRYHYLVFERRG